MELLGGNCSYIKENNVLCKKWECKGWKQIFTQEKRLMEYLGRGRCNGGKTKIISSEGKFRLHSSEKDFY